MAVTRKRKNTVEWDKKSFNEGVAYAAKDVAQFRLLRSDANTGGNWERDRLRGYVSNMKSLINSRSAIAKNPNYSLKDRSKSAGWISVVTPVLRRY